MTLADTPVSNAAKLSCGSGSGPTAGCGRASCCADQAQIHPASDKAASTMAQRQPSVTTATTATTSWSIGDGTPDPTSHTREVHSNHTYRLAAQEGVAMSRGVWDDHRRQGFTTTTATAAATANATATAGASYDSADEVDWFAMETGNEN